jgi:diguanylate cyclase (GGDEF)-like protein/PAS domain S-box-containing protein
MDLASIFSRGNKLAGAICALIVIIGFGTNYVLSRLAAESDLIRVDQLRLGEFKAQLNQIPGLIDSMHFNTPLGGQTSEYTDRDLTAARQINALSARSLDGRVKIDQSLRDAYFLAARREIKAISLSQFDEALQIRQNESIPAFRALTSNLDQVNLRLGNETGQVRTRSQITRNATFVIAGLLIVILVIGFHRVNFAETLKERARHEREISGLRFAALVQNSTDVIVLTSRKGIVTLVNDACQAAWNLSPRECVGKHILSLFHVNDSADLQKVFEAALADTRADVEAMVQTEIFPGEKQHFQVHIQNLLSNAHVGGMVFTFHDITERAAVEEALTHEATHDVLTGLPNRSQVLVRLAEAITRAKENRSTIGALFIDLDNFKTINDTLGHEMGDQLLINVAKRIEHTIRPADMAARLGGDEFVVILENAVGQESGEAIAKRLADQFALPFRLGSNEMAVTASIGIALSDENDHEPNDILRKADAAMYSAKRQGKSGYVNFDPSMKMEVVAH